MPEVLSSSSSSVGEAGGVASSSSSVSPFGRVGNERDVASYYKKSNYGPNPPDDGVRGHLIDGKAISAGIRKALAAKIVEVQEGVRSLSAGTVEDPRPPGLTVVLVGEDPASKVYVSRKQKACDEVCIDSTLMRLPAETTPQELLDLVDKLNKDDKCDGILVQLPLPTAELRAIQSDLLHRISPKKDVDGFHPENLGLLMAREPGLRPCTPFGVMHLIWSTGVNPYGLRCLVVGASNHVGRPMVMELLLNGCSVSVAHKFTKPEDLETFVREAECVIVAVGKPGIVKGEWIRDGAIVIDVGINRVEATGKLVGDVEFDTAKERARWITPVPGGVGPMTVAMLLQNTVQAYGKNILPGSAVE
ncbi:unnamed protein product [Amoebophrya sp. A120]|nr:unnamed protein product [Amoebophrya sp. A120]|eukprot:GSA120T00005015001.1